MERISLQTKIEDLYFPPGCSTIPNALKRTKKSTLKEVYDDYIIGNKKWPMTGQIRYRLIANWFSKCVDIPEKRGELLK